MRRAAAALVAVVLLLGAVWGGAHLLNGRSSLARAIAWGQSDIGDRERFPARAIPRGPQVSPLEPGPEPPGLRRPVLGDDLVGVPLDAFLAEHATRAFLVLHDGRLVYERYFDGASPTGVETSFSAAKSFVAALVGLAVADGSIGSLDDPVTRHLPELGRRDRRFDRIRLRDLLTMSSGIRYVERGLPWSDDALTYYATDMRHLAVTRPVVERPPGAEWRYNNFHPLLLGLVLERATGMRVAEYMARRLWGPMGAEADASWSLDSEGSGFEKMESGLNARARDFLRFGRLMLEDGGGVLPRAWAREATSPGAAGSPVDFYAHLFWVRPQAGGRAPFAARGRFGQLIAVVPEHDVVVVRLGGGDAGVDWFRFAADVAERVARG
jgi:CubicO group peptidase (beta-lactamase class C family)